MLRFAILCAALTIVAGTNVERCRGDNGDLPMEIYIEGCTSTPCDLRPNHDVVMHTVFRAPRDISFMNTVGALYIKMGTVELPIPYGLQENEQTCNYLENASCPIQEGQIIRYTLRHHIGIYMPLISAVRLEYLVLDETRTPVFCVGIPVVGHWYQPPISQQPLQPHH